MLKIMKFQLLNALPLGLAAITLLLYAAPKYMSELAAIMPLFHLYPIYVFGLLHPRDVPYLGVAAIGLCADIVMGLPFGLSGLLYCTFLLVVVTQRKYIYKEGFIAAWGYFAILIFVLQCCYWLALFVLQGGAANMHYAFIQWALSITLYPLAHWLCYGLAQMMAKQRYRWKHA